MLLFTGEKGAGQIIMSCTLFLYTNL